MGGCLDNGDVAILWNEMDGYMAVGIWDTAFLGYDG
jgi:hypothetical protein